jgi:hypothetical protein
MEELGVEKKECEKVYIKERKDNIKIIWPPDIVVHFCNPTIRVAESGGLGVQGQNAPYN